MCMACVQEFYSQLWYTVATCTNLDDDRTIALEWNSCFAYFIMEATVRKDMIVRSFMIFGHA